MDQSFWKKNHITRILAADDEEVICQNVQLAMEGTGVTVDYVLSGQEAVERFQEAQREGQPYPIVLLDWRMPGMDGLETARRLRRESASVLLILLSSDTPEEEEAGQSVGVDAFLSKPFFLTSFRKKVEAVLHRGPEPEAETNEASILKGMHILVVEDNAINAEILMELLDIAGATCEVCENGQLAVDAFAQSQPGTYQLILMDVQMPVMNGYAATRAIRAMDHPMAKTIPIFAMTANAFAEDVRDALDAGMNAHVSKPVDMAVLEEAVREAMAGAGTS